MNKFCTIAKVCFLEEIVKKKPLRYETFIDKDFTNLSGKRTTKVFENLGNQEQVEERFGKEDTLNKIKIYQSYYNYFREICSATAIFLLFLVAKSQ